MLEVLREPMEAGHIVIARANGRLRFPARFQLVAAMNPCPCGYLGEKSGHCKCSPELIARYRNKLSGPLLDRIDLHVNVAREPTSLRPASTTPGISTALAAQQVKQARQRQLQRQGCSNSLLSVCNLHGVCVLKTADRDWLEQACERLKLSLRASHRILKVARTLADLDEQEQIGRAHLAEALQYRFQHLS